jgi:hypothetical protein
MLDNLCVAVVVQPSYPPGFCIVGLISLQPLIGVWHPFNCAWESGLGVIMSTGTVTCSLRQVLEVAALVWAWLLPTTAASSLSISCCP